MKKALSVLLTLAICICLCACKSSEVKNVEAQIDTLNANSTYQEIHEVNSLYGNLSPKDREKVKNLDAMLPYCNSSGHFTLSDDMLAEIKSYFTNTTLGMTEVEFSIMYSLAVKSNLSGWSDFGNIKIASHKKTDSYTYSVYGTFTVVDKYGKRSSEQFELTYYAEYDDTESCGYNISHHLRIT